MHEMLQDLFVGRIAQSHRIEVVFLHKLVEEVGTKYHRLRDRHLGFLILVQFRVTLNDIIEECQTTTLTSQRALTNTGEVTVSIKLQTVEHCHHTDILHAAILYDGIKDDLSVSIHIFQLMPGDMFQEC